MPKSFLSLRGVLGVSLLLISIASSPSLAAFRVGSYNLLNYDNQNTVRDPAFQTVMATIPTLDILAVQEVQDAAAAANFRTNVLQVVEPNAWATATFFNDPAQSFNQGLFYRIATMTLVDADTLGSDPRDIAYYTLRPMGYTSAEAEVTLFSVHLKAGSAGADLAERLIECQRLRAFMNAQPAGTHMMVLGDYNVRASGEAAYNELIVSQANNIGRLQDPLNSPGTWYDNGAFDAIHTQSTRTTLYSPSDGGATGGMDDRFDQILATYSLSNGQGTDQIASTYDSFSDGNHFNLDINVAPVLPEGQVVADALRRASDHMPVFMQFQVPAKIDAEVALLFGTVLIGASAQQTLHVSNIAVTPADELEYSMSAGAGFTAPGGGFVANAGAGSNPHTITMVTATEGVKGANLTVTSDDPDDPTIFVSLSGTVLRHASPSLAAGTPTTADTLDFGMHAEGDFTNGSVDAHNRGYDALQALLEVYDANLSGSPRFSVDGGFSPANVGGTPEPYSIAFDDAGATGPADSMFTATLTFSTRDQQGLPGAANQSNLVVTLLATVTSSTTATGDPAGPLVTRLLASHPNPFAASTAIHYSLAEGGAVRLSVYDLRGSLVRTLADGWRDGGDHQVTWDGRSNGGRSVPPGVYFYRLETAEGWSASRRLTKLQ